jgi:ribonuclease Z
VGATGVLRGAWARLRAAGLTEVEAVAVHHCPEAAALVLAHRSGWRVVYSGDCRPSDALARRGARCSLLIHEATFEPDLQTHALQKRHCTTSEVRAAPL